eukprot:5958328-Pleurochrysis_carterae.AAC.1
MLPASVGHRLERKAEHRQRDDEHHEDRDGLGLHREHEMPQQLRPIWADRNGDKVGTQPAKRKR